MNFKSLISILFVAGFFVLLASASNSNLKSSNDNVLVDLINKFFSEVNPLATDFIYQMEANNLINAQNDLNSLTSSTTDYKNRINNLVVSQDMSSLKNAFLVFLDDVMKEASIYNTVMSDYNIGNSNLASQHLSDVFPVQTKEKTDISLVVSLFPSKNSTSSSSSITSPTTTPIKNKTTTITTTAKITKTPIKNKTVTIKTTLIKNKTVTITTAPIKNKTVTITTTPTEN